MLLYKKDIPFKKKKLLFLNVQLVDISHQFQM